MIVYGGGGNNAIRKRMFESTLSLSVEVEEQMCGSVTFNYSYPIVKRSDTHCKSEMLRYLSL